MVKEAILQIKMDSELKEQAELLYKQLGTSFAEAVRIFAKQSVEEQAMPFQIHKPSSGTKQIPGIANGQYAMPDDIDESNDEKIDILTKRQYLAVKANELIQKNRFELPLPEQKAIIFICSMIEPVDPKDSIKKIPFQLEYEFNIRDYCKICGIDYGNGKNYTDIKAALQKLSNRSMCMETETGKVFCRWLSKVWTNKRSGIAKIRIDEDLAPYLFDLKQKFTQYQLYNVLAMKSAFSVRLYEIMKLYAFQKSKVFDLDELKRLLMVDTVKSYKEFSPFRQKVLEMAQKEINKLTDLNISFEPVTKGRKVIKIKFIIQRKDIMGRMAAEQITNGELGGLD